MSNQSHFELPGKVEQYLATVSKVYQHKEHSLLQRIVVNGAVSIQEEYHYDNWNGGTYGHALTFALPEDLYVEVADQKDAIEQRLAKDINKLNSVQNEHIAVVFLEMKPSETEMWRESSGVYRPLQASHSISAEAIRRIWGAEHIRVFLSHKAKHKVDTSKLKKSLLRLGISSFVAHEDIEPTEEWQREIERALFSMDAMVALLTDDYHDSEWTDQEVGVALGRGVPLIPILLGKHPYGLMGKSQAIRGCKLSETDAMAAKVFQVLHRKMPDKTRLFECVLEAYSASVSWAESAWKVEHGFSLFDSLTDQQVEKLLLAYRGNSQNKSSFQGMDLLKPLLEKWTKSAMASR